MPTFRNILYVPSSYAPMKMEHTECSETLAFELQTTGNNPEESIRHSKHGESLKLKRYPTAGTVPALSCIVSSGIWRHFLSKYITFRRVHFNMFFGQSLGLPGCLYPSVFPTTNLYEFILAPTCHMPGLSDRPWFDHSNNFCIKNNHDALHHAILPGLLFIPTL
jgi:hypothetical protein